MFATKINVTGPGAIINSDVYLIKEALESMGYVVEMTNDYPLEKMMDTPGWKASEFDSKEAIIEHWKQKLAEDKAKGTPTKICLIANHLPWGG